MIDLSKLTIRELLALHVGIADQLRLPERGVTRTSNNLTGDFAEYLFLKAFRQWKPTGKSHPHVVAINRKGKTYQIKGRRCTQKNGFRRLGDFRELGGAHFHFLAAVLFNEDYSVYRAALIPHAFVEEHVGPLSKHINAHIFNLTDNILKDARVENVTDRLRSVKLD